MGVGLLEESCCCSDQIVCAIFFYIEGHQTVCIMACCNKFYTPHGNWILQNQSTPVANRVKISPISPLDGIYNYGRSVFLQVQTVDGKNPYHPKKKQPPLTSCRTPLSLPECTIFYSALFLKICPFFKFLVCAFFKTKCVSFFLKPQPCPDLIFYFREQAFYCYWNGIWYRLVFKVRLVTWVVKLK